MSILIFRDAQVLVLSLQYVLWLGKYIVNQFLKKSHLLNGLYPIVMYLASYDDNILFIGATVSSNYVCFI